MEAAAAKKFWLFRKVHVARRSMRYQFLPQSRGGAEKWLTRSTSTPTRNRNVLGWRVGNSNTLSAPLRLRMIAPAILLFVTALSTLAAMPSTVQDNV